MVNLEVCSGIHDNLNSLFTCDDCIELFTFCHCTACDIVINLDYENYVVINDNTFCKDCSIKEVKTV